MDWEAIGAYINSLWTIRATNVVKFAHDWQHNKRQISQSNGGSYETVFPTGYGVTEAHHNFLSFFCWGLESLWNRGALYFGKWVASYEVGASQKTHLERHLERQGGVRGRDHELRPSGISHGINTQTISGNNKSGNVWS